MRVDGVKLLLPPQVKLGKVRMPNVTFPDLGRVEDIRRYSEHELRFAFVPLSEAGETLARAMRSGSAWMEFVPPRPHVDLRGRPVPGDYPTDNLTIRVKWERDDDPQAVLVERQLAAAAGEDPDEPQARLPEAADSEAEPS